MGGLKFLQFLFTSGDCHDKVLDSEDLTTMKTLIAIAFTGLLLSMSTVLYAQNSVGIGTETPNPNAVLELVSPNNNQGLLIPKLTTSQRTDTNFTSGLSSTENGLMVFDSDENSFYYWQDNQWMPIRTSVNLTAGNGISIVGDVISNTGDGDADPVNEIQDLQLLGDILSITNNGSATDIDLSTYTNTDSQGLSQSKTGSDVSLSISGGTGTTINVDDADSDATNEIQDLQLSGNLLSITNNGSATDIDLAPFMGTNTDNQTLSLAGTNLAISGGNTLDLTPIQDGVDDADNDATNELQTLTKAGSTVSLSNGGGSFTDEVDDADNDASNELQSISLLGTDLTISSGNTVNLSVIQDGVDDADNNASNELQTISKVGSLVTLSNSGGSFTDDVDDADNNPSNEIQSLSLNTTNLTISGGNTVDLSSIQDGVDDADNDVSNELQTISKVGSLVTLSNSGGSFTDEVNDADASATNEIQDLNLSGNTLTITNNGSATPIDLSPFAGTNTDNQTLTVLGTNLTITGGNTVDLSSIQDGVDDADNDASNELQTINKVGSLVTLSNSGGSFTDDVDDADNNPANEIQSLSLNTTNLTISGGNTVDLSSIQDGVDDADNDASNELQTINKVGSLVTLSNSGGSFTDDVDDADNNPANEIQSLSLNTTNLTISGGNTVDLSSIQDGVDDADNDASNELQTINKVGNLVTLSNSGGSFTDDVDDADNNPGNEIQSLGLSGTNLSIQGANTVDLSVIQDGVDDADNNPNNEIQTIAKVGSLVTLSNGGGSFTDAVNDADASVTNETIDAIALSGTTLRITEAGVTRNTDLASLVDDADASTSNEIITNVALSGTTLRITEAGLTTDTNLAALVNDADASTTNEIITNTSLIGNTLRITEAGSNNDTDLSAIASQWTNSGANINFNTGGNVSVGTTTTTSRLNLGVSTILTTPILRLEQNSTGDAAMNFNVAGNNFVLGIDNSDGDKFKLSDWGSLGTNDRLVVDVSGNVGIGTNSPSARLDVNGSTEINGAFSTPGNGFQNLSGSNLNLAKPTRRVVRLTSSTAGTSVLTMNPGDDGQEVFLIGAGGTAGINIIASLNTTANNRFILAGGVDFGLTTNRVLHLIYDGVLDKWLEISRSSNVNIIN